MDRNLHILHLEDEPNDVELVQETLEQAGLQCRIEHVATREAFVAAIDRGDVDLVLSDYSLPAFDGFTALGLARARLPDVPFIFVSGTLGEEAAVESLKHGATDYVLKQRLSRLGPAARRALEESAERRRRRQAEAVLEQERHFLLAVLDSIEAGVVACDESGAFTLMNRAAREIHGLPDQPEPGERWAADYELFEPDGSPLPLEMSPLLRALRGERLRNVELVIHPRQGTPRTVLASAQPIEPPGDRPVGAVMAVHDISDRKSLEEQFRHAQKMEAVGRLAGGVAHDFNNILTVILGCSQMIEAQLPGGHAARPDLDEIGRAAERAAGLTRQLLAFSRQQVLHPRVLDLNAVVGEIEQMLGRLLGPDVELATSLAVPLGPVKADPGQVQQVLLNLAVNARDAMPAGGRLSIETREVRLDPWQAEMLPDLAPGTYVQLLVSDTGTGMDAGTRSRIFEPFFTTKEPGRGTGLGLSIVHGIVKQSGGHVDVASEPGEGSTFIIYLPRVEQPVETAEPAAERPRAPRGAETVLLVEDEDPVRSFMKRTLEGGGYRVIEARDGEEALGVVASAPPVDLVITDILMPRMRGTELADRLAESRPDLKVLLVTGNPDPSILGRAGRRESPMLLKPFAPDALLHKVRQVLETGVQAA